MRRLLLPIQYVLLFTAAPAFAQGYRAADPNTTVANPVIVANDFYGMYLFLLIAIGAVIAILLVLIWVQLGTIRAAIEKQAEAPKT